MNWKARLSKRMTAIEDSAAHMRLDAIKQKQAIDKLADGIDAQMVLDGKTVIVDENTPDGMCYFDERSLYTNEIADKHIAKIHAKIAQSFENDFHAKVSGEHVDPEDDDDDEFCDGDNEDDGPLLGDS